MVLSRLNVGIEYNTDIIDRTKDIGHESSVYEITVKGEDMEIVHNPVHLLHLSRSIPKGVANE